MDQPKSPIIHRRKLFGGRQTAQEVHAQHAFPPWAKCGGCGSRKQLQSVARVLYPLDEMRKRDPLFDALMSVNPQKFMETIVQTIHGPYIRLTTVYCCRDPHCQKAFAAALAKQPSWAIVDKNDGPGPDRIVVSKAG